MLVLYTLLEFAAPGNEHCQPVSLLEKALRLKTFMGMIYAPLKVLAFYGKRRGEVIDKKADRKDPKLPFRTTSLRIEADGKEVSMIKKCTVV
ncbi:unnamed protein product [Caenorhabditis auriculariae]|uniref:Uncharacterized protein n=1 Tax=Caenorhabditis auriculariae TaxID=2777116 RepID=A0A8S1GQV5_9PELO|nr:unnamed protein product [Caenorhabditis auriculariae]